MLGAGTSVQGIDQEAGGFFGHLESFSHADTKSIAKTEDGFLEGVFREGMADLHLSQTFAKDAICDLEIGDARWIGEAGTTVLLMVERDRRWLGRRDRIARWLLPVRETNVIADRRDPRALAIV